MIIKFIINFKRALKFPYTKIKDILIQFEFKKNIISKMSDEQVFEWIYKNNYWGNSESVSGYGSTLQHTKSIRVGIPDLIKKYNIKSIFDAPCGDMNWMAEVLSKVDVNYIGADIVDELIQRNNEMHAGANVEFRKLNLLKDPFPQADLMVCRDFLFHLSNADVFKILKKFIESGSKYILTTTYNSNLIGCNIDIKNGDFRYLDLTHSPFNIKETPLLIMEDYIPGDIKRYMHLWTRDQIRRSII